MIRVDQVISSVMDKAFETIFCVYGVHLSGDSPRPVKFHNYVKADCKGQAKPPVRSLICFSNSESPEPQLVRHFSGEFADYKSLAVKRLITDLGDLLPFLLARMLPVRDRSLIEHTGQR